MNNISKKTRLHGIIFASCLLLPAVTHAQSGEFTAEVTADSLLCEGKWVTITASANGCSVDSYEWFKVMTDGSVMPVNGSAYYHDLQDNVLKTMSDGEYRIIATCDDGRTAEGIGQVLQETDDSKCS